MQEALNNRLKGLLELYELSSTQRRKQIVDSVIREDWTDKMSSGRIANSETKF